MNITVNKGEDRQTFCIPSDAIFYIGVALILAVTHLLETP